MDRDQNIHQLDLSDSYNFQMSLKILYQEKKRTNISM